MTNTIPARNAKVAWNDAEDGGDILVGPYDEDDWDTGVFENTHGACNGWSVNQETEGNTIAAVTALRDWLVVEGGLELQTVHKAFLRIEEYRARWAP